MPSVILSPSFTSISQVSSPAPASQTHVGAYATVQLNLVQVAERVQAPEIGRHVVASVLRAIARGVATPCARTPARPVCFEFGFALLEFVGGKTVVRWSRDFVTKFESALGLEPDALSGVHRATTASATASTMRASSGRRTQLVPAPPPVQSARIPPPPQYVVDSVAALTKASPGRSPSASSGRSSASSARSGTSPRQPSALPSPLDAALLSALQGSSPRKPQGAPPTLPDVSPYYRHKLHKLDVRRQRKKAYLESWEQQLVEKARQREDDKLESRRIADAFDDAVARGIEADARELEERRLGAKELQQVNVAAAAKHSGFLLSHIEPANDLFEKRPLTANNRDVGALVSQRNEKEQRRAAEVAEDRLMGQRLAADARAAELEAIETKLKRAAKSREYLEVNKVLAATRRSDDDKFRKDATKEAHLMNSSPSRFLPNDETRVQMQAQRDQLVLQQKEEVHQHRIAQTQQLLETKAATGRRAHTLNSLIHKTILLHEYETELKGLQQAKNRAVWTAQMKDNSERRGRDRADKATRLEAIYRNESSDDEA